MLFTICYSVRSRHLFRISIFRISVFGYDLELKTYDLQLLGVPMKMPVKDPSRKTSARKTSDLNRCVFETSDGRRCRLPRSATHASLCVFHSREEQQLLESRKIGTELAATLTGNFLTATDLNYALGKVFTAVAQNRIPVRTAHTLAYLGQLMLFSLPDVKHEFGFSYKFAQWNNMLNNAVRLSDPPPDPATLVLEGSQDSDTLAQTEVAAAATSPKES